MSDEFGREFRKSLQVVAKTNRTTLEYRKALGDLHQTHLIKSKRLRAFIYHANRVTLERLSDFCRVDLLADERSEIRWRRKWWPYLVLVILLLNVGRAIDLLSRQYAYDIHLFTYDRLQAKLVEADAGWSNTSRVELRRRFDEASERMRSLNATAHSDWPFISEMAILFHMPQCLILHVLLSILFNRTRSVL